MLAHQQIWQCIKTKHKSTNVPGEKICIKISAALGPWTWLLHVSSWRFTVWQYVQFLACPKGANFSMVLPCIPISSYTEKKSSKAGSPYGIHTHGCEGSSGYGYPRRLPRRRNYCRLWSFTWKMWPLAISDQLIVVTSLKIRNEDAFFQSRTIRVNLW